ncbi:beta strand repeat-containing protein [Parapusillimonas sp. JC17]|uniref:beta strand repeat-containing protein n=1 Tax=Parapusillimonas sp. JC17 TaxID=3445768 RepID=UPI003FA192FD
MANPYFNAAYYLATNLDVLAAGYTVETAEQHYLQHGAVEALSGANTARKPAPWFDIQFYLTNYPDLLAGGVTAQTAFQHFVTHGQFEQRSPANGLTVTDAKLQAYADANEDLRTAFDITDTANLTAAQKDALTSHFYQYGYTEDRPGAPFDSDVNPGGSFTLTTQVDDLTGTAGDDVFNAITAGTGQTLNTGDLLNGAGGNDTLKILSQGVAGNPLVQTKAIENVEVRATAATALSQQLMQGVEVFASEGSNNTLTVNDASLATTYALNNTVASQGAGLTVTYAAGTLAGKADTAKLSISNAGDKTGTVTTTQVLDVANGNAIEAVALSTAGVNYVNLTAGTGAKTVTVSGDGTNDITLGSAAAELTLDASATTGTNTFRVGTQLSGAGDVIKGGKGADTLVGSISTTTVAEISGIETLDLTFTGPALFNASKVTDVKTLDIANTGAATFSNLNASVDTIKFDTTAVGNGATLGYATGADTDISVTVGKVTTAGTSSDAVGIGGLTLSGTTGAITVSSVADKATTVNNTGAIALGDSKALTLDANKAALTAGNIIGAKAEALTLNATGAAIIAGTFVAADALATVEIAATKGNVGTGLIGADDSLKTVTISAGATDGTDHVVTTSFGKSVTAGAKDVNASLTISGEGDANVTTAGTGTFFGTVDATASTGSVNLDFSAYTGTGAFNISLGNAATGEANTVNITGATAAAIVTGGSGVDNITGGAGADVINGGAGADVLNGGAGADVIDGGAGADTITGGAGADVLTGGAGVDSFSFVKADSVLGTLDVITDYRAASGANAGAADTITITDLTTVASAANTTVLDYTAQASLAAAVNAAATANVTDVGLTVFLFGGNTYAYVEALGAGNTYVATDWIVEITGTPFAAGTAIAGLGIDGV